MAREAMPKEDRVREDMEKGMAKEEEKEVRLQANAIIAAERDTRPEIVPILERDSREHALPVGERGTEQPSARQVREMVEVR